MALPWLLMIAGVAVAADYRSKRKTVQTDRYLRPSRDRSLALRPSEFLPGKRFVSPQPGSVVVCHVYGVVEHSGIWLGDDTIAELHGSGLIRGISAKRFLTGRTGATIFTCCDHLHRPFATASAVDRAAQQLFTHRDYHLRRNNCHRFVWYCLTGEELMIRSFDNLNRMLADFYGAALYWDPVEVDEDLSLAQ
ncbi:hypothetical protein [Ferrimonas lipolytica]|uniref:Lecithin retinol acyltransferase n=1 Tax=Ferrimonas lipolytica TaxID=2724191 RepID=A0A6H1UCM5_9GAMM|nr:hypothetical protein [Ferrimonas lipolytica]QIZ76857.1 hypothetical protein HER31_08215 [Ferrimonas lipolytica]